MSWIYLVFISHTFSLLSSLISSLSLLSRVVVSSFFFVLISVFLCHFFVYFLPYFILFSLLRCVLFASYSSFSFYFLLFPLSSSSFISPSFFLSFPPFLFLSFSPFFFLSYSPSHFHIFSIPFSHFLHPSFSHFLHPCFSHILHSSFVTPAELQTKVPDLKTFTVSQSSGRRQALTVATNSYLILLLTFLSRRVGTPLRGSFTWGPHEGI